MIKIIITSLLLSLSGHLLALDINAEDSSVHFISVKKNAFGELHHFNTFSGQYTPSGKITLDIDLASLNTGIDIRDQRIRDYLFDVLNFPWARFSAAIDPKLISNLGDGDEVQFEIEGSLSLHGVTVPVSAQVGVQKLADGGLRASTIAPVMLRLADFNLLEGVGKLQELAGLSSIDTVVPVSFYLKFR